MVPSFRSHDLNGVVLYWLDSNGNPVAASATTPGSIGINQINSHTVVEAGQNGVIAIGGSVASGASDSGYPIKIGGRYNSSAPILVDGQRGDAQLDVNANLKITLATLLAGEDLGNNVIHTELGPSGITYSYISGAGTYQIKSGAGKLYKIIVNTTAAGTVAIIDGTSGTTANIGQLKSSVAEGTFTYDLPFQTGLRLVVGSSSDLTIVYR